MDPNDCTNCSQLKQIKALSRQVLKKYDELLHKYKENEDQYNEIVQRLKEREGMLEDMKKLIEPAMSEHERLMMKYDIEIGCRNEAENVARKMTFQNKALKRQSQALLEHIGKIDITQIPAEILEEPTEGENDSYKDYTDNLNTTIQDLEEKVSYYATALAGSREELSTEREDNIRLKKINFNLNKSLSQTKDTLLQYQNAMVELTSMSESAYEEYEELKNKCEIEANKRSETEKIMLKIKTQNEAMKTQSTILLSNVANDQQLTKALCEVEELKTDKSNLEQKVNNLQKELESSSDVKSIEELETEKSNLSIQVDDLTKKVTNYENLYSNLEKQYKELEEKLEQALRPPPPPPPPLPPPPPTAQSKGFLSKMASKKKRANMPNQANAADFDQQSYGQAMDEMMKRINSGNALSKSSRATRPKPSKTEPSGAMKELHSVLNRYKKPHDESDGAPGESKSSIDPNSELSKVFKRVKKASTDDVFTK
ncbi:unnamed protein product [Mytilus edulis]|uniref:Shootin-1 n=1 Tax=Mytilus edulis TaxID=6550 RepID=A0A8S3TNY7_MYTED|nr:unnamed protein product [Mytilus edulis]